MTINVENLDQVEAWSGAEGMAIPVGDHFAEIEDVEEATSGNGNPQLIITWRVLDGVHRGATSREWLVILPQTYGKVRGFLEAVGWEIQPGAFAMPTRELIGRRAQILVREDTYGGKVQMKIVGHNPMPANVTSEVPIDSAGLPAADNEKLPF